jgi:hypothetical protein
MKTKINKRFLAIIEKELIFCVNNVNFTILLFLNMVLFVYMTVNAGKAYAEFLVFFPVIWITNSNLLGMIVYKDKIQGRIPQFLGFGFRVFDIIVGKAFFICGVSVFMGIFFVMSYRVIYYKPLFVGSQILLEVLLVDFFAITLSVFLIFKYGLSRAINIIFLVMVVFFLLGKEIIPGLFASNYLHLSIILIFFLADFVLLKFIKGKKNEFFF